MPTKTDWEFVKTLLVILSALVLWFLGPIRERVGQSLARLERERQNSNTSRQARNDVVTDFFS